MAKGNGSGSGRGGVGFLGLLALLLIYLKLNGTIACSWWVVTAPLWGPMALAGVVLLVVALVLLGALCIDELNVRLERKAKGNK